MTLITKPLDPEEELARDRAEFEAELPKMVYISGALTDMPEEQRVVLRRFYTDLGRVCKEFGFVVYLPHIYGDPKLVAHKTPKQIDEIDRLAVTLSCLVIAYVGVPSIGVGIEIEMANHANKPVILLFEKEKMEARRISRLVRGNVAVREEVAFTDFDHAVARLRMILAQFKNPDRNGHLPPPLRP